MVSRHYLVSGRVQGVGFRNFVFKRAIELQLNGKVRNLDDGRVEILATGNAAALSKFESYIAKGPVLSRVDEVKTEAVPDLSGAKTEGFTVLNDGAQPWSFNG